MTGRVGSDGAEPAGRVTGTGDGDAGSVRTSVTAALAASRDLDALAVTVEAADGVVGLSGTVRTHAERLAATETAAAAAPGWTVRSDLVVELSADDADDAELASRVARALADLGPAGSLVGFDVSRGVVVLGGRVAAADRATVRHAVEQQAGVDVVHDRMRTGPAEDRPADGVIALDADACWRFVAGGGVARLATADDDGVDITPIDVLARHRMLYFRTAPGSKLERISEHPRVAVELDGLDGGVRWSVVVRGRAERLDTDSDIEESGVLELRTAHPSAKENYVRVRPDAISGREFPA